MKKVLFSVLTLAVALCGSMSSKADPVDAATARKVAKNLFIERGGSSSVDLVDVTSQMPYRNLYFFKAAQGDGFVILSADDRAVPVIGYSIENTFDPADLPEHIDEWFRHYDWQIDQLIADDIAASAEIAAEWKRLIEGAPNPRRGEKAVNALLTTTWDQGSNTNRTYNYMCPDSSGKKPYAGCTAVATAQVMKYWEHPTTGRLSHSYQSSFTGTTLSANFANTTYAWSNMPNALSSSSSTTQRDAIATLLYHIGVAIEMDYGTTGSGGAMQNYGYMGYPSAEEALKTYFKYSCTLHSASKSDYTDAQWIALLKAELDASTPRPIIYSGFDNSAGHSFVLDGYNNSNQFHVNWGWSGRYNGHFTMGALNPTGGGAGGNQTNNYNYRNTALLGVKPAATGSSFTVNANANNSSYGSVNGGSSYNAYDTVSLVANTNEGYRFKQWSDGATDNPRQFIINDNVTLTAQLELISGDTLYHTKSYPSSYLGLGAGNTLYWGVKFPTSALTASRRPTHVLFYARYTGTYTVYIYNDGATAPSGSPILSGSLSLTNTNNLGYISAGLGSSTPTINANKPLWVVLKYTNTSSQTIYCIPLAEYSGNQYSKMRSSNGTSWSPVSYSNSWAIQLINAYTSAPVGITEAEFVDDYSITNGKGYITITGAENQTVRLIDNSGRVIATDNTSDNIKTFVAPTSGVYLIQVGDKPAHKVVVKK